MIPALDHSFGEWKNILKPACGKPGTDQRQCSVCGKTESRTVKALYHVYGEYSVVTKESCQAEGIYEKVCTLCGDVVRKTAATTEHQFGKWGKAVYHRCEDGGIQTRICDVCGFLESKDVKPRKHAFAKWETIRKAGCNITGLQVRKCRHCEHTESRELAAKNHWLGRWRTIQRAQLFVPGKQVRLCRRCGEAIAERYYTLDKKNFAVSFSSYGIKLSDILGVPVEQEYYLTPVQLDKEGVYEYPLIADRKFIIGTVRFSVKNGQLTIGCRLNDEKSEILKTSMRFYTDIGSITPKSVGKKSRKYAFDKPINIDKVFGGADDVVMVMNCDGIYDSASELNLPFDEWKLSRACSDLLEQMQTVLESMEISKHP